MQQCRAWKIWVLPCCKTAVKSSVYVHFPGYYWITADNGSTMHVFCDFESEQFLYTGMLKVRMWEMGSYPTMDQREGCRSVFRKSFSLSCQLLSSLLTCTTQITGLVACCPSNSCSQVFDLIHEGLFFLSNYYWLQWKALKCKPSAQLHCMLQQPTQMKQALFTVGPLNWAIV